MLSTPLLSIRGKLRFLAERWIRPLAKPTNQSEIELPADESVGSFVRRRMGQEVLDRIVAPLSAGIYTADISKLSMQATMGPIAEMEREYGSLARATAARRRSGQDSVERSSSGARYSQFRAFRGGMIELISALAASLPPNTIHVRSPVQTLDRTDEGWEIQVQDQRRPFDQVVMAVPPLAATRLLRSIAPSAVAELSKIESASVAIAVLGVRRKDVCSDIDTFGFVVPLNEHRRILAGSFASNKFAGRAPDDHVLIRVFVGGAMQSELLAMPDDQIMRVVREELADLIGLRGEPVFTRLVRWTNAMPQYHVGHLDRVKRIEQAMEPLKGLTLVSNALRGVGIAPVIQLANQTAIQIANQWHHLGDATSRQGSGFGGSCQDDGAIG
jgi:oxygen-dependent protoporphyrinogen oxidase